MPHHHGRFGTSAGVAQGSTKSTSSGGGKDRHSPITVTKPKPTYVDHRITVNSRNQFINTELPPMKDVPPGLKLVGNILDSMTGASVKNRKFFVKNYERIKKNKKYLPSQAEFDVMSLVDKQKLYRKTRLDIMRSNQNPFGETDIGGEGGSSNVVKKVVGGQTLLAQAPTEAEVSQSDATNAAETKLTKRRVKARGRKMNIYAQAKDKLTLGKKSLLGYV
jgi:hypothetical protein